MFDVELFVLELNENNQNDCAAILVQMSKRKWIGEDGEEWSLSKTGKVLLTTSAWDCDKREIWEIPEARQLFLFVFGVAMLSVSNVNQIYDVLDDQTFNLLKICAIKEKEYVGIASLSTRRH